MLALAPAAVQMDRAAATYPSFPPTLPAGSCATSTRPVSLAIPVPRPPPRAAPSSTASPPPRLTPSPSGERNGASDAQARRCRARGRGLSRHRVAPSERTHHPAPVHPRPHRRRHRPARLSPERAGPAPLDRAVPVHRARGARYRQPLLRRHRPWRRNRGTRRRLLSVPQHHRRRSRPRYRKPPRARHQRRRRHRAGHRAARRRRPRRRPPPQSPDRPPGRRPSRAVCPASLSKTPKARALPQRR